MNVIPISKEQKRAKSLLPSPCSFKGFRNRAAASKPARLIDPVVNLTDDWLISQPSNYIFYTEPNSHFICRSRDTIHSSGTESTRLFDFRQPPFSKKFPFSTKAPFSLPQIDVFSFHFSRIFAFRAPDAWSFSGFSAPRLRSSACMRMLPDSFARACRARG